MAELALAIIPLGMTVTSGLVKYLKSFNDHDDDHARLVLQAERFKSTFQSLDAVLKRSQLNPEVSSSTSEASVCLKECQQALNELDTIQQNIFSTTTNAEATTPHGRTKGKIKRLLYPLRKSDVESLDGALRKLSAALNLALGMLHLDEGYLTRNLLNQQMVEIQNNTIASLNTSTTIEELRQPILRIGSTLPVLQTSVDAIVPHLDRRIGQLSDQQRQMQALMKSFLDMSRATTYQDCLGTNQQLSYNHFEEQVSYLAAREGEPEPGTLAEKANSVPRCSCQLQRVRKSKRFVLGPMHLTEEMVPIFCHEKDCGFYIPSLGYEKTRIIRFNGFASFLKKGFEVSFSRHVWAGRYSISPSFTYFPVVNEDVAPAFLLMSLLREAIEFERIDEARSKTILSAAQQKLQELFCLGRASPIDVTQESDTLLHHLCFSVYKWSLTPQGANSPFVHLVCTGLVNFLIAAGTSVTVRNNYGYLALHGVLDKTFVPASIYNPLNAGNDVEDRRRPYSPFSVNRREILDYYEYNQSVARIQYGPLGLAIIRNNLLEVERLISLYPHTFHELSFYGETPLHIAIFRPETLKALVKKANPEDWIRCNHNFATVLHLAIQVSHEICKSGDNLDDICCPCTLPLRIILNAGCPIIPYRDFRRGNHSAIPDGSFSDASFHCKTLLAQELRSRRRQLRDLARNKLSITEFSNLKGMEDVPDVDAIEMDRLLRQKGVLGLGPLSTFADEDLLEKPCQDVGYYSRSIFFDLKTPEDADLFVDFDFKMICADQHHDSSVDRAFFGTASLWIRSISLDYAIWLFDHQAPLWKWSYRFISPMPSIFVLADIVGMQDYKYPGQEDISDRAEAYLSESFSVDDCSCLCSPGGCTPFSSRMKWLAHPHEQAEDLTLQDYATRFGSHVDIYGRRLNMSHHVIMTRQATFAALGLRHTCVDRPGCGNPTDHFDPMFWLDPVTELDSDEMEFEILNIDVEARNQLEEVVVMFQDFVLTGRETTISNKGRSFGVNYAELGGPSTLYMDEIYYQRVLQFWECIWGKRMQVALDTVAKSWGDKLDGLNNLVQVSTCEEAVQETEGRLKEGDEEIFNRLVQRIQDI